MDLLILEDLLTILRKNILPCFNDISYASRLESLIHAARIQVSEAVQRTTVSHSVTTYIQMEGVGILGENMASSFDFEKQMEVIAEELPRSGMKSGFICLYEDPGKPLDKARLVMAFNEDVKINLSRKKLVFPTTDLLPGSIMKDFRKNRFNVIVQALYHADSHLGYAIFDYGKQIIKYIETIRYRLSLTFKGALLIDKIRKQAENLEVQVATRTCELSEANMLLEEEIKRRKKVEEQLKKALGHLEVHNRKLHYQSLRDELTGLYNRRGFMTLGIQHYHYALNSNRKFLVIYADMDGLKQINDEFGHKEGDFAIARSAEILSKSFRNMDIVARLGGDEFTILMVDASMKDFVELKKRLQNSFETYNKRSGKPYRLSVSIGTTCFDPEAPFPFDELLIQADKALYEEKHHRINK